MFRPLASFYRGLYGEKDDFPTCMISELMQSEWHTCQELFPAFVMLSFLVLVLFYHPPPLSQKIKLK